MTKCKIFLMLICLLFVYSNIGFSQISPGDLAEVHAHLEGITNCTECHVLGDKVTNEKCLVCHTEIQTRINQKKGFHASIEIERKTCVVCHNDHNGRNFEIIRFKTDTFNHMLTGYDLLGKHGDINCQDCHKKELIKDQKLKERMNTYLGLGNQCLSCHADYHQGSLSKNCTDCHNQLAFKPTPNFDHNKTKFVLIGKHKEMDCLKCHLKEVRNGKDYQNFSGLKFNNCSSCHKDVHQNKFGQYCTDCHNENSFREVKRAANFNHNLTNFPLKGEHQKADCKECHKNRLTEALPHKACTNCHADYHKNDLDIQNQNPECDDCHSVAGFKQSSYSIEKHNQTHFTLKGAHIATPCFSCHFKNESWHFRNIGLACIDCHQDIHKGFIGEKFYPEQNCKICHAENQWSKIQFDHKRTDFELKGAHQKQGCSVCHFQKSETDTIHQKFASLTGNCIDCHIDKHQQQFAKNEVTDCVRCHGFEKWTITDFNHNKTLFPLEGAHEKVSCKECHKEINNVKGNYILYKIKEFKCADCHS